MINIQTDYKIKLKSVFLCTVYNFYGFTHQPTRQANRYVTRRMYITRHMEPFSPHAVMLNQIR